jgi:alpha-mannosidase
MFWTVEKLQARINEIEGFRYRNRIRLNGLKIQEDPAGEVGQYPPAEGEWKPAALGDDWKGRDAYVWVSIEAGIPSEWAGRRIAGLFDLGRGGGNSGFESLLFVNGRPYQGVDSNHEEVFLPSDAAGTSVRLDFRLWSGLGGYRGVQTMEHRFRRAELAWLDEAADDLYYTGRAVLETVKLLSEERPERFLLLAALDRAFLLIDWSRPGSDEFYASIEAARDCLNRGLEPLPRHHDVTVTCIGHTHIDVAWLWRLKHTREKAARSFSTVLRLMEQFPEYIFLQTQPQLYAYLKEDYPEIYEQIRDRIREGRWEAGGAMWLEADCNLTSGESLVRQLLYGTRFFREEFGVECRYLWLPDVFGYSWALPQILKKSGIEAFMTTKISWNQYNRMPHDTFLWRGIDGTEILTHFITTPDPGGSEGSFYYTYNGKVTPQSVQGIWNAYRDKELNRNLLLAYGYGDGGGGVNREMLEMRRRLENMPGLPKTVTGRADAYFRQLQETVAGTDRYVHTWDGELYLELHRGTYTSQAYNKRMNRKLELLYREAEWLGTLGCAIRGDWSLYRAKELHDGWIILLRNQFHDIIPGSSIREVYEDSRLEYAEAEKLGKGAWRNAAEHLLTEGRGGKDGWITVFNGASWERSDLVQIPADPARGIGTWRDAAGRKLPSQRMVDGSWLVEPPGVPPMGFASLVFAQGQPDPAATAAGPFAFHRNSVTTPFYEIRWNDKGQLIRLHDRQAGREVLADNARGNVFQVFEDKPKGRHEAWDIDLFYQEKMREIDTFGGAAVEEAGPLAAVIRFQWTCGGSSIIQRMVLYAGSRRIDFRTRVDWHEQRRLLKVAFPVEIRAVQATYDIQFGNVKRPTHWNTSWDYARFECAGHQWADLSESGYGVSLLNDCKYGYDIKDNVMRLTLIKSALVPDARADQGEHDFVYSLLPHQGDWLEAGTVREAWALNNPLSCAEGRTAADSFSLFRTSAGHVMIDAVKKAEDGGAMIVRMHEYAGSRGKVRLIPGVPVGCWQECDLLERPLEPAREGEPLEFRIKPYEIKTFRIELREAPETE